MIRLPPHVDLIVAQIEYLARRTAFDGTESGEALRAIAKALREAADTVDRVADNHVTAHRERAARNAALYPEGL